MDASEQNIELRPFDRVRLKSGGPLMLVISMPGVDPVRCTFKSESDEVLHEFFPAADLEKGDRNGVVFPPSPEEVRRKEAFAKLKAEYGDLLRPNVTFECGDGWIGVLTRYFDAVREIRGSAFQFEVERVYQKYGQLNIDTSTGRVPVDIALAVSKADMLAGHRALRTCEDCGEPGHLREDCHWLFVACEEHSKGCPPLPASTEQDVGECSFNGLRYIYDEEADHLVLVEGSEAEVEYW